jgi:hypothetical protein
MITSSDPRDESLGEGFVLGLVPGSSAFLPMLASLFVVAVTAGRRRLLLGTCEDNQAQQDRCDTSHDVSFRRVLKPSSGSAVKKL